MNKRNITLVSVFFLLSGCSTVYGWADSVGKHMPTIGEPCRHWQCITTHGKRQSDQTKWVDGVVEGKSISKKSKGETLPKKTETVKKPVGVTPQKSQ